MKSHLLRIGVWGLAVVLAAMTARVPAGDVATDGAAVGEWTMDLDAATKLSAEKKLPLFLNFTGSDWCGWCKLMDKAVFAQPEWVAYAKGNLVLVQIDFPKGANLVPERYVSRNLELQQKFGVKGFPAYVVLDNGSVTELGRLGAGEDVTVAGFLDDLANVLRFRASEVDKVCANLTPERAEAYRTAVTELLQARTELRTMEEEFERKKEACEGRIGELDQQLELAWRDGRAKELGPERGAQFLKLCKGLDTARAELDAWFATRPPKTAENVAQFEAFQNRIQKLQQGVRSFQP